MSGSVTNYHGPLAGIANVVSAATGPRPQVHGVITTSSGTDVLETPDHLDDLLGEERRKE